MLDSSSEFKHFMFAQLRCLPQAARIGPLPRTDAVFIYSETMRLSSRGGSAARRGSSLAMMKATMQMKT